MPELPSIAVTERSLQIDDDLFGFDEVTSVGYVKYVTRASGAVTNVERRFELWTPDRRRSVNLDGARVEREERNDLWAQLVAVSQQAIEPRLRNEALNRIQRYGETVEVGKLALTRAGFAWKATLRQRQFTWPEHRRTIYENSRIKVIAHSGGKDKTVAALGTEVPNAVLLPKLMSACGEAFTPG